ncbi:Hypothetical protein PP7435_CHR1-1479 [Komagataella phaffii CBS 7435]|uniref:Uncharacterized protein n=2 Tax=Komagataella phaffii TaxID=460519 RepID=C4QZ56_KOMPG|nr:Hypothetical protein PAS_c121_0016 [Komagataella phaffii GS115]CAH2447358.1 Hypothetical protein BQ9382_C1-7731 [Komagataella phaffii CBS 7435]CAY68530.1 Hypothetical protein PAS_c121_0016 [Komagataella phaffii GS115]CCA37592.1 Hypothetical protein PP7435_CHR1-1479 [Komagataella phaffii CBS 7435]
MLFIYCSLVSPSIGFTSSYPSAFLLAEKNHAAPSSPLPIPIRLDDAGWRKTTDGWKDVVNHPVLVGAGNSFFTEPGDTGNQLRKGDTAQDLVSPRPPPH